NSNKLNELVGMSGKMLAGGVAMRLVSWIGGNDLDAAEAKVGQPGAIAATLASASFAGLHLLYSYPEKRVANYLSWLSSQYELPIETRKADLASPVDFHDI